MNKNNIVDLIAEIEDEVLQLDKLAINIEKTRATLPDEPEERRIHEESLALKLHNFYTGCERVFKNIAKDVNGGVSDSLDWHRRLLHAMSLNLENIRPAVISGETEAILSEFLSFRHVVRNIYGFSINSERLGYLLNKFGNAFQVFKRDILDFVMFLKEIAKDHKA
jgi:hypothetical protein